MQIDKVESEQREFQTRLDALLKNGAECLVKDGGTLVTSFYLDSFELLQPQLYFDRLTGELDHLIWWCWLREVHFEAAMQRSHLIHVKAWEWINDRNLNIETDDHTMLISALDPPEVDGRGNAVWKEWQAFKQDNPWLEAAVAELRETYMDMARRGVG